MEEFKMKKLLAAVAAAMIMAVSAVPAFAVSVNSPVATTTLFAVKKAKAEK